MGQQGEVVSQRACGGYGSEKRAKQTVPSEGLDSWAVLPGSKSSWAVLQVIHTPVSVLVSGDLLVHRNLSRSPESESWSSELTHLNTL